MRGQRTLHTLGLRLIDALHCGGRVLAGYLAPTFVEPIALERGAPRPLRLGVRQVRRAQQHHRLREREWPRRELDPPQRRCDERRAR